MTNTLSATDWRDALSRDVVLMRWESSKKALAEAKEKEMEWRRYVVKRAFPQAKEGTNTTELGNGYILKATVSYNYNLDTDLDKVEKTLDEIAKMGNEGTFLADRLVKWEASFLLTEYRKLCEDDATDIQKKVRRKIEEVLTITNATPKLEIKAPRIKK